MQRWGAITNPSDRLWKKYAQYMTAFNRNFGGSSGGGGGGDGSGCGCLIAIAVVVVLILIVLGG